jgi:hypothetical protein
MSLFKRVFAGRDAPVSAVPPAQPSPAKSEGALPSPLGENNYLLIVLDSCRYDSFMAAEPKTIMRLGPVERRWSYASWTSPSHYNLLMGLLPHRVRPTSTRRSTTSATS